MKREINPGQVDADWLWQLVEDADAKTRAEIVDEHLAKTVFYPARTAQLLLSTAIAHEDQDLLVVLVRRGATIKGTLFENLVHPETRATQPYPDLDSRRSGRFNLSPATLAGFPIPSEADWHSEPWGIDTPHAYEHFYGLDVEAARDKVEALPTVVCEDFLYMPAPCLWLYLIAYMEYLLSPLSQHDSDAASQFFAYVGERLPAIEQGSEFLLTHLRKTLSLLGASQEWFDADPQIYGDFGVRARDLLSRLPA